jgi:hypothetical protein
VVSTRNVILDVLHKNLKKLLFRTNDDIVFNSNSSFFYGYLKREECGTTLFLILTHPSSMDICRERRSGNGTEKLSMSTLFDVPTHSPPMAICRGGRSSSGAGKCSAIQ